jgi:hypothetical protein
VSIRGGGDNGRGLDLTIWGISDPELLGIVDDLADENGWTTNIDVRMQLGEKVDEVKHSGVGSRLAWMRRYGWLERNDDGQHRLTAMGHQILDNPKLARAVEQALDKMNPAQRLALTRELGEYGHTTTAEVRVALRRQWQRSLGR